MAGGHVWKRGVRGRYYEIRSMSRQYASYWNAFLLDLHLRSRSEIDGTFARENKKIKHFRFHRIRLRNITPDLML